MFAGYSAVMYSVDHRTFECARNKEKALLFMVKGLPLLSLKRRSKESIIAFRKAMKIGVFVDEPELCVYQQTETSQILLNYSKGLLIIAN